MTIRSWMVGKFGAFDAIFEKLKLGLEYLTNKSIYVELNSL